MVAHDLSQEDWASFTTYIGKRTDCDGHCRYYYVCPYIEHASTKAKCKVIDLKTKDQQRFLNIFILGEGGLREEMLKTLYSLSGKLDLEDNLKDMGLYLDQVSRVHKALFNEKDKKPVEKPTKPPKFAIKGTKLPKKKDEPLTVVLEDGSVIQDDPHSLLGSPVLDANILRKPLIPEQT